MDAISFVLGVKSSQLRSSHLKELLYRSNAMQEQDADLENDEHDDDAEDENRASAGNASGAYVKAVYEMRDGTRVHFKRRY